jgi:uncharacterized alpha-E superfamily protein
MICDETNPRSIAYQLVECAEHVRRLPNGSPDHSGEVDHGIAAELLQSVRHADIIRESQEYEAGKRERLVGLLTSIEVGLPRLSDIVSHLYFFHSAQVQQLTEADFGSEI